MAAIEYDQTREYTHEQIQLRHHDRMSECLRQSCIDGHLSLLQLFHHQYKYKDSFAWSKALTEAIRYNQLSCIRFILEQHTCKASFEQYTEAIWKSNLMALCHIHQPDYSIVNLKDNNCTNFILNACHVNWVEGIDWLLKQGCQMNVRCTMYAAHLGQPECLRYLLDQHCPASEDSITWCRHMSKKADTLDERNKYKECEDILVLARKNGVFFETSSSCFLCTHCVVS